MVETVDLSNNEETLNKLKEVSFFNKYADNNDIIKKIAKMCTKRQFPKDMMIIKEGDSGDELFIILKGKISILKKTLQDEEYTVTTLSADMGGINVGELALIDNDKRSASVVAETNCECLVINRDNFIKFGNENPEIGLPVTRAIARQLSSKLRKTNQDVITLFSALVHEFEDY
ncbi:cyclic nucleotide-binding domain-containing protein [Spirochaetota bacterium]